MTRYLLSGLALLLASTSAQAQGLSRYGMDDYYGQQSQKPQWEYDLVVPDNPVAPREFKGNVRPEIFPVEPDIVYLPNNEKPGTIIISNRDFRLFLILSEEEAYAYPISIGREGFSWTGVERVSRIQDWPDWTPPKEMLQRRPDLPTFMAGGLKNPLGAKAIYLGNTLYRIHGTNDPKSIGRAESSGCIRMMNEHVVHLAQYVEIGTIVKVY